MRRITKTIKLLILIVGLAAIVLSSGKIFNYDFFENNKQKIESNETAERKIDIFKEIFENFDHYKYNEKYDIYDVYDLDNELLGSLLFDSPYCEEIKGYGGHINLVIAIGEDSLIKKIQVLEHSETKSWFDRLYQRNFFETWTGLTIKEALSANIDAISGATLSSSAIINTINCRLSSYSEIELSVKKEKLINIIALIASVLVLAIAIFSFFSYRQNKSLRIILLIASVGILGFWQGGFLSVSLLSNWLINGVDIKSQIFLFSVLVISVLLPLVTNKSFYCQYLCPFGAAQELTGKLNKQKIILNHSVINILKLIRNIFLFVIMLLLVLSIDINLENLEPFSAFKFQYASLFVIILALVMLVLSIFFNKPWCRFFCPTGALLAMLRGSSRQQKNIKTTISTILNFILIIVILIMTFFLIKQNKKEFVAENNDNTMIMKTTLEVIHNRKSVRHYTDKIVTKEQLEILVRAGMAAPSARNLQPWHFVIIQNQETMNALADSLPYAKMLKNAQAAIVVCGDLSKAATDVDNAFWVQDCSAATQNILLAAESIGLGAVWTAAYPYSERVNPVKHHLNLPEHLIPLNVIPIGYPTEEDKPKDKWNEANVEWE